MTEKVLHEWLEAGALHRVLDRDGKVVAQFDVFGNWRDAYLYEGMAEIARLAAENAKLRACVEAAIRLRDYRMPTHPLDLQNASAKDEWVRHCREFDAARKAPEGKP